MKITERCPPDEESPYLVQLPEPLILEILCRIPIQTLAKCRAVCRFLRSLFSDPQFAKQLFTRTPQSHLLASYSIKDRFFLLNLNDASTLQLTIRRGGVQVVGSCNGFFCLHKKLNCDNFFFYISNPITGEFLLLPKPTSCPDSPKFSGPFADREIGCYKKLGCSITNPVKEISFGDCCASGFGFCPISQVFKLLLITTSVRIECPYPGYTEICDTREMMVLTVGSGSWKHIGDSDMIIFNDKSGVYLNGYLHWIARTRNGGSFMYAFDVETECFQHLPLPGDYKDAPNYSIAVLNGCLCLTATLRRNSRVDFWVLKDYAVKESWTKQIGISCQCLGVLIFVPTKILYYAKEQQVLLFLGGLLGGLRAHTPGTNQFVRIEVYGMPSSFPCTCYDYIPTFLSLKDFINCQNSKYQISNLPFKTSSESPSMLRTREIREFEPPAVIETKLGWSFCNTITCGMCGGEGHNTRTCKLKDQAINNLEGIIGNGSVQVDAAEDGNVVANQGNLPPKAAQVIRKQQEKRAPKKAKTTHKDQLKQDIASQPVSASSSSSSSSFQPRQPLAANHFIYPITEINMNTKSRARRKRAPAKK